MEYPWVSTRYNCNSYNTSASKKLPFNMKISKQLCPSPSPSKGCVIMSLRGSNMTETISCKLVKNKIARRLSGTRNDREGLFLPSCYTSSKRKQSSLTNPKTTSKGSWSSTVASKRKVILAGKSSSANHSSTCKGTRGSAIS